MKTPPLTGEISRRQPKGLVTQAAIGISRRWQLSRTRNGWDWPQYWPMCWQYLLQLSFLLSITAFCGSPNWRLTCRQEKMIPSYMSMKNLEKKEHKQFLYSRLFFFSSTLSSYIPLQFIQKSDDRQVGKRFLFFLFCLFLVYSVKCQQ